MANDDGECEHESCWGDDDSEETSKTKFKRLKLLKVKRKSSKFSS
jgi:hypothetical protein